MEYRYINMLSDMRQDLAKYVELYPACSSKPTNRFKVLLHSPGFYVIASYRMLYWLKTWQETSGSLFLKILLVLFSLIAHRYWAIAMKSSIAGWPEIGAGLYFSNKGGIIMGPKKIGSGCVIHHNVTIGKYQMNAIRQNATISTYENRNAQPDIGNNVWIGANSLIYGEIITDGVIVEAETIVGKSLLACVVIKGNPGRIVRRNIDSRCI